MREMVPFGSICTMSGRNADYTHTTDFVDENEGIIVLTPENIQNNSISYDNVVYLSQDAYRKSNTGTVHEGDILLCKYARKSSPYRSVLVKNLPSDVTVIVNSSIIIISDIKCIPEYLQAIISSHHFQNDLSAISVGNLNAIKMTAVAKLMIPLLSVEREKDIGSKMVQLGNKHNELIDLLQRELDSRVKIYNQLVDELLWGET